MTALFARPLTRIGIGVAIGVTTFALVDSQDSDPLTAVEAAPLAAYAIMMFGVCLLACLVPARRALRAQLTDALRFDG